MNLRRTLTAFVSLALAASVARAGGYYLPGRGVRAFSRGGAFVVGADDLTAIWYNPALLAGLPGTRVHLDAAAIFYSMRFQRYPVPEVDELFEPVQNASPPAPGLSLAVSSDFGLDDFVFAFGFYTPYGSWGEFPEDGAQRYSLTVGQNLAFDLSLCAAWEPLQGLRVGAGFRLLTLEINEAHAVSTFPGIFGAPEDRDLDGIIQLKGADKFSPTGVAGIWVAPGAWIPALRGFELGISFIPGMDIEADGSLRVRLPGHVYYDDVFMDPEEPPISMRLKLPWVVRGGIRYRDPGDRFDVEANIVWERWSTLDEVVITLQEETFYRNVPTIGDYKLRTTPLPRQYQDTLSIRLGGSYRPLPWLVVRAGLAWESGAPPDSTYIISTPDSDKVVLGAGAGVILGAVEIDLGYMHIFVVTRDIRPEDSLATQTNPSNPEGATTVGGGRYESSYDVVGLSFMLRLDALWQ